MLIALLVSALALAATGAGDLTAPSTGAAAFAGTTALAPNWTYDIPNASDSLATVAPQQDASPFPILVSTFSDAQTWMLSASGALLRTIPTDRGIVGEPVPAGKPGTYAIEDAAGRISIVTLGQAAPVTTIAGGRPVPGGGVCAADLDADGVLDLLRASREGLVVAYDMTLTPRWQFDAGAPILRRPAVAPLFEHSAAVFVYTADGALIGLRGDGTPLWRTTTGHPDYDDCRGDGPLVVQLHRGNPSLVFSDMQGGVYSVNAVDGILEWRTQVATADVGGPAIIDGPQPHMRQIVTVSEQGALTVLDVSGSIVQQASLPKARYIARPLVADVDGDGAPEVVVADREWGITVATLGATVKARVPLRGCASAGLVMEDLDQNGSLELLATTNAARVYCFSTKATGGWLHPRASVLANGYVSAISRQAAPPLEDTQRHIRLESVVLPDFQEGVPCSAVFVKADAPAATNRVVAVVRNEDGPVGSAVVQPIGRAFVVPCVRLSGEALKLDVRFVDRDGRLLAVSKGNELQTAGVRIVSLPTVERFLDAVSGCATHYSPPASWLPPVIHGRSSWHLLSYRPEAWDTYGLADVPFVSGAMPYLNEVPSDSRHPAWSIIERGEKPFLLGMGRDPQWTCPPDLVQAVRAAAGPRFLGFYAPNLDVRYRDNAIKGPAMKAPLAERVQSAMMEIMDKLKTQTSGAVWEGQASTVFHHQAFEWGALGGVSQVGNDGTCASLHFAFLRGAARQYGGLPWGVEIRNTYGGALADGRFRPDGTTVLWAPPHDAKGLNCGHSPSLESRLEMAAHLAGVSMLHHESDLPTVPDTRSVFVRETQPGLYAQSSLGKSLKTWYDFATHFPDRGMAYTPLAFVLDFGHGWQPLQDYWGSSAEDRTNRSIGAVLNHAFAMDSANDLERGYLTNTPYGDIFDVVTDNASDTVMSSYGVLWPLGASLRTDAKRSAAMEFVKRGGILVLDAATARAFPESFLGARFRPEGPAGTQIQMALGPNGAVASAIPFRYRALVPSKDTEVLAWSDSGAPFLAWRKVQRGIVVLCGSENWLDEHDHPLPVVPALMRTLSDAFLPVQGAVNVQLLLNRMTDGWVIGLINNNGVKKSPTQAATVDPKEAVDCVLRFRNEAPLQFSPRFGQFQWDSAANGLSVRIQPGDVAIVKAVTASIAR